MNDGVLQIDVEADVKLLQEHWLELKEQQEFINLTPFTYNIEIMGCMIEDNQYNVVPLRLGDILKLQKIFQKLLLPIPMETETVFYKLKRLGNSNGCLFSFNTFGEHFIWSIDDIDTLFEAIFAEVGLAGMNKNKHFLGDYLCPSIATLEDYLTSITKQVPLEQVVCDRYINLQDVPLDNKISYIIPLYPYGSYIIDTIDKIDWKKLKAYLTTGKDDGFYV